MALNEEARKMPAHQLLLEGIPAFAVSVLISMLIAGSAPAVVHRLFPSVGPAAESLAGPAASVLLALLFFALFMRHPGVLFFPAMAFVNAAGRAPETLTLWWKLFFRQEASMTADERSIVSALHLHNSDSGIVILCFYSLFLLFLTITIIHESKQVPWKWPLASTMMVVLIPAQPALAKMLGVPVV